MDNLTVEEISNFIINSPMSYAEIARQVKSSRSYIYEIAKKGKVPSEKFMTRFNKLLSEKPVNDALNAMIAVNKGLNETIEAQAKQIKELQEENAEYKNTLLFIDGKTVIINGEMKKFNFKTAPKEVNDDNK